MVCHTAVRLVVVVAKDDDRPERSERQLTMDAAVVVKNDCFHTLTDVRLLLFFRWRNFRVTTASFR